MNHLKHFSVFLFFCLIFYAGCVDKSKPTEVGPDGSTFHGKKIEAKGALTMKQLMDQMEGKKEMPAKVTGEIEAVCKAKGCWMTMKRPDDKTMRVTLKDYGFFVPKDCNGKNAVVEGIAKLETTSVADLKHYAEDEGLSQAEIDKITEPEMDIVFVADGAIVK